MKKSNKPVILVCACVVLLAGLKVAFDSPTLSTYFTAFGHRREASTLREEADRRYKANISVGPMNPSEVRQAITGYKAALHLEPDQPDILIRIGDAYAALGDAKNAHLYWKKAVQANPKATDVWVKLAESSEKQKNWQDAATFRQQLVRLQPDEEKAISQYAYALEQARQFDSALNSYHQLADTPHRTNSTRGQAFFRMGEIERQRQRYPQASTFYRQSVDLTPSKIEGHYRLAQTLQQTGDIPQARSEWMMVIALSDKSSPMSDEATAALLRLKNKTASKKP